MPDKPSQAEKPGDDGPSPSPVPQNRARPAPAPPLRRGPAAAPGPATVRTSRSYPVGDVPAGPLARRYAQFLAERYPEIPRDLIDEFLLPRAARLESYVHVEGPAVDALCVVGAPLLAEGVRRIGGGVPPTATQLDALRRLTPERVRELIRGEQSTEELSAGYGAGFCAAVLAARAAGRDTV
jgi:hypothetical protein